MRKSFALSLVLVIVGVMGGLAASSASANYRLESATGGTIEGEGQTTHEFLTDVGTVKCTTAMLNASQATETAETLTLSALYTGCTLAGVKVNITMNKCHYLFTKPTTTEPAGTTHAIVHVKCATEGSNAFILIKDTSGLGCEVKIAEQETKGTVMMTNEVFGTVKVESNVEGIAYSWTAGCPNAKAAGSNTNGKYVGSSRLFPKNPSGFSISMFVT